MKFKDLQFRPATMADAEMLLAWRNDPETRRGSISQDVIPLASHLDWLEKSFKSPDRKIFICVVEKQDVGTIRLDREGEEWELSWTVNPEMRGFGIGKVMVARGAALIPENILAKIRSDNLASIEIAKSAGFKKYDQIDVLTLWRLTKS